jgi:hypothetical protein
VEGISKKILIKGPLKAQIRKKNQLNLEINWNKFKINLLKFQKIKNKLIKTTRALSVISLTKNSKCRIIQICISIMSVQ